MNAQQRQTLLAEVRDHIEAIRAILDAMMYDIDARITDEERARLRAAYERVCEANDEL